LSLTNNADIIAMLERFDREAKALKEEVLRYCWYMRGGLSYSEGMELGFEERQLIGNIIKDNMETTKKSGMPFF
jgi:hypothetical protein